MAFVVWSVFLSGLFEGWGGGPGVIQWLRLQGLLKTQLVERDRLEAELQHLDALTARLRDDATLQEREIRRVLGYVAKDELIFDFTSPAFPSN